jgi:tetratricopeptide (TPR) repeat protein
VASLLGVSHILQGSYLTPGDKFNLNISVLKADTKEVLGRFREEGTEEEITSALIDKITRRVKSALDLTSQQIASDIDKKVGQITTLSQQALKYYLEGWKHHLADDYERSREFMEKAIALDPEFVMAHRTMAWASMYRYNWKQSKHHIQKAFDLTLEQKDRISEREFYLIQADYYGMTRRTWNKSIVAYQRLLEIYPDDFIGRFNLGDKYFALENWDKAVECFRFLTKYKDYGLTFQRLSWIYSLLGDYDKQKNMIEEWKKHMPDDPDIYLEESRYYRNLRDFEKALKAIDKALAVDPNRFGFIVAKGYLYFLNGDLSKAREEFLKLQRNEAELFRGFSVYILLDLYCLQGQFQRAIAATEYLLAFARKMDQEAMEAGLHIRFARVHLESGNMEAALRECEGALEMADKVVEAQSGVVRPNPSGKIRTIYFKGLAKVEMGAIEEAQEAAERLRLFIEEDLNQNLIRFYWHLLGRIELKKENYPGAIEYFEQALSYIPPGGTAIAGFGRFSDSLALAYFRSGELEKARDIYENTVSLMGVMDSNVIYPKTFYMLGKVYEGLGNKEKATANYQRFLDIWKDADPGLPEPADAKTRLVKLQ